MTEHSEHAEHGRKLNAFRPLIALAAFAVAYFGVKHFVTNYLGLPYSSPMWEWIAFPAFFLAYLAPGFLDPERKTFLNSWWGVPAFFVIGVVAFYLGTYFFYLNNALNGGYADRFAGPNNPLAYMSSPDYCYTQIGQDYAATPEKPCQGRPGGNAFVVVFLTGLIALVFKNIEGHIIRE